MIVMNMINTIFESDIPRGYLEYTYINNDFITLKSILELTNGEVFLGKNNVTQNKINCDMKCTEVQRPAHKRIK